MAAVDVVSKLGPSSKSLGECTSGTRPRVSLVVQTRDQHPEAARIMQAEDGPEPGYKYLTIGRLDGKGLTFWDRFVLGDARALEEHNVRSMKGFFGGCVGAEVVRCVG